MTDNLISKLFDFGKKTHNIELKQKYLNDDYLEIDHDTEVAYKPTPEFFEFLDKRTFKEAFNFLAKRYSILKPREKAFEEYPQSVEHFPQDSVAYGTSVEIFTRELFTRISQLAAKGREGLAAMEELKTFNQTVQHDAVDNGRAGLIRDLRALEVVVKAMELNVLAHDKVDFTKNLNNRQREYMKRGS